MSSARSRSRCLLAPGLVGLLCLAGPVLARGDARAAEPPAPLRLVGWAPARSESGALSEHIGVGLDDGRMAPILRAGSPCDPCRRTVSYSTAVDDQTEIPILLLRGAGTAPGEAVAVSALEVRGLAPAPAGRAHVRVTVGVDGRDLWLEARDARTGALLPMVRVGGTDALPAAPSGPSGP